MSAERTAPVESVAALVDFLRSGERYYVWVVRNEGEPKRCRLSPRAT